MCVGSVCMHPPYNDTIHTMFFFIPIFLSLFSNQVVLSVLSDRAVVHWQARQYHVQYRRWIAFDYEHDISWLVSELRFCVLTAAPFENRWWLFTTNHGTSFTDEMRMRIIYTALLSEWCSSEQAPPTIVDWQGRPELDPPWVNCHQSTIVSTPVQGKTRCLRISDWGV